VELLDRVERQIRRHGLIEPGGEVTCLVSGGPDSTCLWGALRELGYRVSALHVAYGLRGEESEADAALCRDQLGAEVVRVRAGRGTEAELRELRYAVATDRLRATGHTASDQVETILFRLASSGTTTGIKPRREDGVVRPLLPVWREEAEAFCLERGLEFRRDSSNADTARGLIREQVVPMLERLHQSAR
jgi:tRNA(Ile)-lysidine synthase